MTFIVWFDAFDLNTQYKAILNKTHYSAHSVKVTEAG